MGLIKRISSSEINYTGDVYYFGWENEELNEFSRVYQHKYFGSLSDASYEVVTDDYESYYVIFRGCEDDESYYGMTRGIPTNYLLLDDQQQALIIVNGVLYRFHLEKKNI